MWGLKPKKAHPLGGPSALSSPLLVAAPLGVIPTVRMLFWYLMLLEGGYYFHIKKRKIGEMRAKLGA